MFTTAFWMWVCVFMVINMQIFLPANAIIQGHSVSAIYDQLGDGIKCYVLGIGPSDYTPIGRFVNAPNCAQASTFWWVGIIGVFTANVTMPLATRYGNATLLWIVRALAVPFGG